MLNSYKNIGFAGLVGILAGALFALVSKGSGLSVIGFLASPIPIAFAGLAFGYTGLAIGCIAAVAVLSVLSDVSNAMLYIMWDIVPVALITALLLRNRKSEDGETVWYPVGYALSWTSIVTAVTGILVSVMLLVAYNISSAISKIQSAEVNMEEVIASVSQKFWEDGNLQNTMLQFLSETMAPSLSVTFPNYEAFLQSLAAVFMALLSVAWFFRIVFAVFVAEYLLLMKNKALRPKPEYTPLYVQNWLLVLIALTGVAAAFSPSPNFSYIIANFCASVSLPFCLLGLSQVHIWARSLPYTNVILTVFYTILSLTLFVGIGLIEALGILAVIGLYEQFVRIYRRYIRPLENGEK